MHTVHVITLCCFFFSFWIGFWLQFPAGDLNGFSTNSCTDDHVVPFNWNVLGKEWVGIRQCENATMLIHIKIKFFLPQQKNHLNSSRMMEMIHDLFILYTGTLPLPALAPSLCTVQFWLRLETCSNLFTWRHLVAGYWSTYGGQAGGTDPTGMLSCVPFTLKIPPNTWVRLLCRGKTVRRTKQSRSKGKQ